MTEELKQAIRDLKRAYMKCYHDDPVSEVGEEIWDVITLFEKEEAGLLTDQPNNKDNPPEK
jgi:hypothetical protein